MKLKYFKNLDGVRGIAALMVMIFHFFLGVSSNSFTINLIKKIATFGQTGVTLFFVLSGFLITRILIKTKSEKGYFKNFYLRRSVRIFPLYYFFLFFAFIVSPFLFNSINVGSVYTSYTPLIDQFYYYTYLQNFARTFSWGWQGPGHFWSLAVEEHFYLFWPFMVYFFSNNNLKKVIIFIIVFALLLRAIMLNNGYEVFYFTFTRFDSLAIGSLLALLELKKVFKVENSNKFLVLLIAFSLPTFILLTVFSGTANYYVQIFKYLFISMTYFSFICYVLSIKTNNFINKILNSSILQYSGKISYGLYVYHPFVYFLVEYFFETDYILINMLSRFILTYIISSLSYKYFESYFLRFKKYFVSDKPKSLIKEL